MRRHRFHTELDDGFFLFAILGSQNGGMVMHMLIDHKHHISLRHVEKVVVFAQSAQERRRLTLEPTPFQIRPRFCR